ncbi:uncharacterized protein LOC119476808 isoform X2 [Sebastes umbrosus]|uniref:uncharacterized protein LOC119476808 isoform X2 n=1 Tax=Sebastes umbrosus TaxID=72105 RepID=UPI00189E9FB6|nr:uncharacterized protein LOC119476808 isoform X2 [Sebastes umbrosus]
MQHLSTKALFQKQFRASEQEIEEAQRQRITMDEFRGIQTALFLMLLLQFTVTEQKNSDEVTLTCSVSTYDQCRHTVKWLFQRQDVDEDGGDLKTSQSLCSASVTFRTSHYNQTSSYQSLKCNVTDRFTGTPQLFPFRLSGEETTPSGNNKAAALWRFIFVSVGLAALIMTVVAVNVWTRIKEKKTQTDEITVRYDADDDTVNYENIT